MAIQSQDTIEKVRKAVLATVKKAKNKGTTATAVIEANAGLPKGTIRTQLNTLVEEGAIAHTGNRATSLYFVTE